jgi:hypothetical protein
MRGRASTLHKVRKRANKENSIYWMSEKIKKKLEKT